MFKNLIPMFFILLLSAGAWLSYELLHFEIPSLEVFGKMGTVLSIVMILGFSIIHVIYRIVRKKSF